MSKYNKIVFLDNVKNVEGLEIAYADISTIPFLPDNIKGHDIEDIIGSIAKFGFVEPIGINEQTGHDFNGNGRLEALQEMHKRKLDCPKGILEQNGKWFAPTVKNLSFSPQDEEILAIRLNQSNAKGGLDKIKAFEVLRRIQKNSPSEFLYTGFDSESMKTLQILAKFAREQNEVIQQKQQNVDAEIKIADFTEIQNKWNVKLGDIFQLGRHFLICGDSTKKENFLKLTQGKHIRLCFTSPPYDKQREYELDKFDWLETMKGVYKVIFENTTAPFDCLTNLGLVHKDGKVIQYWQPWLQFCEYQLKKSLFAWIVWDKLNGRPGNHNGRLADAFEFIFHHNHGANQPNKWIKTTGEAIKRGTKSHASRNKNGTQKIGMASPDKAGQEYKIPDSVIRLYAEQSRGIHTELHPATFPAGLPEFIITTYSDLDDCVYEPFGGSGTTLLACENLQRQCFIQEISPNYCALILERFNRLNPNIEIKQV